ncbi:Uncharacterized protein conserved in archaea [Archaeoglobus sulfaticallidus PM70-1]|uniref:Uncharacterized protein conserved in archaea n=1 Tax=Archaeoglobus sulfaticallidus PM70-1 TaxID=387631 RepID=N0BEH3_9EURY|nr:presenilin family intramembrane aspartyl protease PSH [Archaeoglobus sulfaticallidus]AGK61413.1 Uncharacterized protein conserved in archaea [Archaeoglobus sulfaticallidus PM70-1]
MKIRYVLILIYVLSAILAILLTPNYEDAGMKAFENPEDVMNSIYYFGMILLFTAFILLVVKYRKDLIQFLLYGLMLISIFYVMYPFLGVLSIIPSMVLLAVLIKKPSWIVIDLTALLLSVGVTTIFGISLSPQPALVLLTVLAVYDFISVYKTGHMVSLADSLTDMKLPMLFVIPFSRSYRLENLENSKNRAVFMGVGDVVIPNILVVSLQVFDNAPQLFFIKLSALFSLIGGVFGLVLLIYVLEKKEGAHPGLPFLNFGAIAGYLIYVLMSTGGVV